MTTLIAIFMRIKNKIHVTKADIRIGHIEMFFSGIEFFSLQSKKI